MRIKKLPISKDNYKLKPESFKTALGTWYSPFKSFLKSEDFYNIYDYLNFRSRQTEIFPTYNNIYNPFKKCNINNIKAIIIADEPFSTIDSKGIPYADGLALSNSNQKHPTATLETFFQAIEDDLNKPIPTTNDLTYLAEQGILLLNSTMTCEHNDSQKHSNDKVWRPFYDFLFNKILNNFSGLAVVTMGEKAYKLGEKLDPRLTNIKNIENISLTSTLARGLYHQNMFTWINKIIEGNNGTDYCIEWNYKIYEENKTPF